MTLLYSTLGSKYFITLLQHPHFHSSVMAETTSLDFHQCSSLLPSIKQQHIFSETTTLPF